MKPSFQAKIYKLVTRYLVRPTLYPGVDFPAVRRRTEKADSWSKMTDRGFEREDSEIYSIPVEWIRTPKADPDIVLVYLHGGGFCMRTPGMHGQLAARICQGSQATGLMPDYRLAPEHPFPAAYEDCFAVYRWLLEKGYAPEKIVIAGDSAGGALTLATLLQAREAGLPQPACAVLISPGINAIHDHEQAAYEADPVLSPDGIAAFREAFRAHEHTDHPISKLLRGDLAGLAPLLFQVGTDELLFDETVAYAQKAQAASVDTTLEIYEGMPHVFQINNSLPESKQAVKKIAEFIKLNFNG